jgi:hypothetical protein
MRNIAPMHAPADKPRGPGILAQRGGVAHSRITPQSRHTRASGPAAVTAITVSKSTLPSTLLTMFCGQDVCSDVPDTGEQPHQEPQGDSEGGTPGVGSSGGRVCAGVLVVEATPDTEVDVVRG